jgi:serine/threonine-protein kinase
MLTGEGEIKIADLGLAKNTEDDHSMTQTGAGMGTPYYMAPEQAEDARRVDHRADIYQFSL